MRGCGCSVVARLFEFTGRTFVQARLSALSFFQIFPSPPIHYLYPELAYDIYRLCSIVLDPAYEAFVPEETKKLYSHFHACADQSQIKTALSSQDDPNPKIPDQANDLCSLSEVA